jgi:hypothetical protein
MSGLVGSEKLCKNIEECIKDLKDGKAGKLSDLASLLRSLAVNTNNEVFSHCFLQQVHFTLL